MDSQSDSGSDVCCGYSREGKKKKKNVMQGHRSWPVTVTVARDKLGQMCRGV